MLCEMRDIDIVMEPEQVCDSRISACNYLALSQVKRIRRTGDGNCLLYSLLGADNLEEANRWRQRIADWIEYNINECVIPEVPIRELVEQEGGVRRYVNKLRSGELWGGLVEIAIYAVLSNQAVVVYEVDEERREYRVQTKVNVHEGVGGQRCVKRPF